MKKDLDKEIFMKKCSRKACEFPNTCGWNQKCMRKELDISIESKKRFSGQKDEDEKKFRAKKTLET